MVVAGSWGIIAGCAPEDSKEADNGLAGSETQAVKKTKPSDDADTARGASPTTSAPDAGASPAHALLTTPPLVAPAGERIHTLGDLIDPAALCRLRESFERLGRCRIAICDADGRRLDLDEPDESASPFATDHHPVIPITWRERVLGHVVVLDADAGDPGVELARLVAEVLGGVCHSEARTRKRVDELTTLYDLSGRFASGGDLPTIMEVAAQRITAVMNVKAASIRLVDEATGTLSIVAAHNLSDHYKRTEPLRVVENPIDAAALSGQVVYIEDARTDPRIRLPQLVLSEGIISALCCPLAYRGTTVGVLRIYTATRQRFSRFDVELMRAVAAQAAAAIVNSRLYREALAAEMHERQLKRAGDIQRRMLPKGSPDHPALEFGQVYVPSLDVGGDFFDFIGLPQGNLGMAIADVVGKGMPGALLMASVRSALRAHAKSIYNIADIMAQVNRHLCRDTLVSEFATVLYGVFSPDGRRFTYCNAGHNPPLLLRGDAFETLEIGGMVIGVDPDTRYDQGVLQLVPGDILVSYTDGVTEAMNYDEREYGYDRLLESIRRYRDESAGTLANQILWDVRRYAGLVRQSDDISVVVAKVK